LQKQIGEREKGAAGNVQLEQLFADVEKKLEFAAAGQGVPDFMRLGISFPEKHPEPLSRVVTALGTLIGYVESADAAPTADMNTASEVWLAATDETLARWQTFLKDALAPANDRLQKAGQTPLHTGGSSDLDTHSFEY
jgi:hypothetical protein